MHTIREAAEGKSSPFVMVFEGSVPDENKADRSIEILEEEAWQVTKMEVCTQ